MKQLRRQLIIIGIIAAAFAINRYFGFTEYLTWDWFLEHRAELKEYVHDHYIKSVLAYIGFYIFTSALAIPGTFIVTIAGGFLFDYFPGVIYMTIGATLGAACAFLASRYLLGNQMQQRYAAQLVNFNVELDRYGFYYMFVLRLLIVMPFFLVNILAGLTRVSLWTFMWTTAVGIWPIASLYLLAGRELAEVDRPLQIFSWPVIVGFLVLALVLLVPMYFKKRMPGDETK